MWFFYALGAAVLWGLQYTLLGRHFKEANVFTYSVVSSLATTAAVVAMFFVTKAPLPAWTPTQWWSITLQILCGLAANLLCFLAIQQKNATLAAFVEICYPLFIMVFAYVLFHEVQLTPRQGIGAGMILAGLLFIAR